MCSSWVHARRCVDAEQASTSPSVTLGTENPASRTTRELVHAHVRRQSALQTSTRQRSLAHEWLSERLMPTRNRRPQRPLWDRRSPPPALASAAHDEENHELHI